MQILTDILSLFKRKQIVTEPTPEDLIVVGRHEEPDMLGIASPIPYKSVKLVKLKDLFPENTCGYTNLDNGTGTNPVGVYINKTSNPCSINLRSICGTGNNIQVIQNANEIEIATTGEPNTASNIGEGAQVFESKVGEDLKFRTLVSENQTIGIEQNTEEVNLTLNRVILQSPNGTEWEIKVDNQGNLSATNLSV